MQEQWRASTNRVNVRKALIKEDYGSRVYQNELIVKPGSQTSFPIPHWQGCGAFFFPPILGNLCLSIPIPRTLPHLKGIPLYYSSHGNNGKWGKGSTPVRKMHENPDLENSIPSTWDIQLFIVLSVSVSILNFRSLWWKSKYCNSTRQTLSIIYRLSSEKPHSNHMYILFKFF